MSPTITGIGGAFIDFTFHVSDERLAQLKLPKAGIEFVDEATQRMLIEESLGELTTISHGGSAANSICTSQLLDVQTSFAAAIGQDSAGTSFIRELERRGVRVATSQREGDTNSVLAFITPDGEKTFVVYPGLAGKLSFNDIDKNILKASQWILLEGQLFAYGEESRAAALQAIYKAKDWGTKVAFNLGSVSVVEKSHAIFRDLVDDGYIDLVIGNRDEYAKLIPGASPAEALDYLGKRARYAIVTAGPDGAEALHADRLFKTSEVITRTAIDSSGAGDAFLGALLGCMNRGVDFQLSLDLANKVAAEVVTQPGARLSAVNSKILEQLYQGVR